MKSKRYYFEQQFEPYLEPMNRWGGVKLVADGKSMWDDGTGQETYRDRNLRPNDNGRNKRTVWSIPTQPSSEDHYASYPEDLVIPLIKSGCPKDGIVLDPFCGVGTTCLVAKKLERKYIGIDISEKYCQMARDRIDRECGTLL